MDEQQTNYADKVKTALTGMAFPATKEQIIMSKGTSRLEVAIGKNVSVREALAPITAERFETREALLNEISTAHHLGWEEQ